MPTTILATPSTLTKSLASAQPGDTIQLQGGNYPGTFDLKTPNVTIEPAPGEGPAVLTGPAAFTAAKVAWLHIHPTAAGATVRRLAMVREGAIAALYTAGWNDYGIVVEAPDVTISMCRLAGMNKGIHIKGATSLRSTITHNHIGPTIQSNIVLATSYGVIRGALIAHNTLDGSYREDNIQFMPNFDIPLADQANDVSNLGVIIYDNELLNANENAIDLKGAGLIVIDSNTIRRALGSNDGALAWNRDARGAIMHGARTTSRRVIVRNNDIADCLGGVRIYDEWKVYHNRIVRNNTDYTGSDSAFVGKAPVFTGVEMGKGFVLGAAVRNNVVGGHKDADVAFYQNSKNGLTCDFNLYVGASFALQYEGAWHYPLMLADWRGSTGLDAMSTAAAAMPADLPLAGALTFTKGPGNGRVVRVLDAGFFTAWFGRADLTAEVIYLSTTPYLVVAVDYDKNELTLNEDATWGDKWPVCWRSPVARVGIIVDYVEPVEPPDDPDAATIAELHALLDASLAEIERLIAAAVVADDAAAANVAALSTRTASLASSTSSLAMARAQIVAAQAALREPQDTALAA